MNFKNTIRFKLVEVNKKKIDGINFFNIVYILAFVDEVNLFTLDLFDSSFIYFKELKKSILKSGEYLIFTSITGVADECGWDYIKITHRKKLIHWGFEREGVKFSYFFNKKEYVKGVLELEKKIKNSKSIFKLEPLYVIYPE